MLPLQQAYEIKHSILEYLKATFSFREKTVHNAFYEFINDTQAGIFKGPFISLKLPFIKASDNEDIPLEILPSFRPFLHQVIAFKRLSTYKEHQPQSTLITTGTSSGKTECFLFPALDYCYKKLNRKGIKVIILYPMNALATDQAKRFAETIWSDDRLKGRIKVGLFIGEGARNKKKYPRTMGEINVIENRDEIIANPPDILLTNFKMLDYGLLRNNYHNLWINNLDDPQLLKFLILDELHTYDGAQGTDVANLIRRLKLKLDIKKGQLCAVGTSATIGSGDESIDLMTQYASKIFGEEFSNDSIIVENRIPVEDFFPLSDDELDTFLPRQIGLLESRLGENESYNNYINRQKRLWQLPENLDSVNLGVELKKLKLVKDIIFFTSKKITKIDELLKLLADKNSEFRKMPEWDSMNDFNPREEILNSLLALISEARIDNNKKFPFLYLQVQIWIRELSGVLREISNQPKFTWRDKVGSMHDPKALPAYYCRECGASGWLGIKDDNKNHFFSDPNQVYEYFFSNHKNLYFINTSENKHGEEYEPNNQINDYLNPVDLNLSEKSSDRSVRIHAVRKLRETKSKHVCPTCNSENSIGIIGTRIATLSSICVSQVLSSDLDPRIEKERKILAFTNSVQDAAHQAGFVEARNYRFTFRSSLQKVINLINNPISLTDLQAYFIDYWKKNSDSTGQNKENAFYYRFFPADYHGRVDIDNDYREGPKSEVFTQAFKKEFELRMLWEITSEFGYNALIGRTLEKSGASAVKFDESILHRVFHEIKEWIIQNNLDVISEDQFLPFLNGILHRIRTRGGVDHLYLSKFRENSLQLWDLNWMRDNRHFLNRMFGLNSRFPRLITTQQHSRGLLDSTFTNTNNWFRSYFVKSFPLAPNYHGIVNDFYSKLFEVFVYVGLMNKKGSPDIENYAIEPSKLVIENRVKTQICDLCEGKLYVAASDDIAYGSKCLDYSCSGSYRLTEASKPNYYQLVYNRNLSPRIYATEHTGILERGDREKKEYDFKNRPNHNSLNAIVATSTLELGIDIGSLNTAINNSVPPLPSNFLQRVGRAGRSSGSALITNFSQNKSHDLFYFEEPGDMMEGEIATPGCYLEAKEILNRHFFAFCLDNWSLADPKNNGIPGRVIALQLLKTNLSSEDFIISRIISFIKSNEKDLLKKFTDFYLPELDDEMPLEDLKSFVIEEGFYIRIKAVFAKLKSEYVFLNEKLKEVDTLIKSLPNDEERRELEAEKKSLWGLKRILDKRSVLEHMTNAGLLPNYAFPETGATLNAWVKSIKAKASEAIPVDKQYEIVRSSKSAIREFAPDNTFYSQGNKLRISGLNTFDWKEEGVLLRKRFCSNCDHLADSGTSDEATCPKCGDSSWSSAKNQHVFVKLNGVKSVNFRDKSALDDSSDERDSNLYRISRHLKFDSNSFQGAWGMKEIPFGIEYVKNVDITEINLGLSSVVHANKISINQHEDVPFHGFITCRHCGKSTSNIHQRDLKFHYGYCIHKDKEYSGKSDEVFEEVYLFREIKTEALKILLPVQEFDCDATINMFKAGLDLGLKKYYKGNPQHISLIDYSEFNSKNGRFDKYVVLFDNIPGGTGYLEKLFSPTQFNLVLKIAYEGIKNCSCQNLGKDGCYRCIFSYTNQYFQSGLSRRKAELLFKRIVDKSEVWETYTSGLGALTSNGQIEESELEFRFIRSLRNYVESLKNPVLKFEDFIENGIVNYRFKISSGDYIFSYIIRPQYELGPTNGVKLSTRSDFYITLGGIDFNGDSLEDEDLISSVRSIAIYLDGYTYHATQDNFRFIDDLKRRSSIKDSKHILSWTLTWNDIEKFDVAEKPNDNNSIEFKRDELFLNRGLFNNTIRAYQRIPYWNDLKSDLFDSKNSFERLLFLLKNPLDPDIFNKKVALFLSLRQQQFGVPSVDANKIDDLISDFGRIINNTTMAENKADGRFCIFPELPEISEVIKMRIAIQVSNLKVNLALQYNSNPRGLEKQKWESFWQIFNLIQNSIELFEEST